VGESFVTGRDARRILDIVGDATAEDPGELFYSSVLRGIAELVPCEMVTLQLSDIGHHSIDGLRLVGGRTVRHAQSLDETYAFWSAYFEPGGCSYDAIRPGLPDYSLVVRRSDRFGDREYLRFAMGRVMRGWSVRHELLAAMQPFGALDRRLLLFRSDGMDTSRQWEVLRLVSLGASNHQIGSHLGISEATVRKHLENIYLRVGAASRTEAIRKVSGFL
jgi:DNA-binding CsgD family transcriptional regulator